MLDSNQISLLRLSGYRIEVSHIMAVCHVGKMSKLPPCFLPCEWSGRVSSTIATSTSYLSKVFHLVSCWDFPAEMPNPFLTNPQDRNSSLSSAKVPQRACRLNRLARRTSKISFPRHLCRIPKSTRISNMHDQNALSGADMSCGRHVDVHAGGGEPWAVRWRPCEEVQHLLSQGETSHATSVHQ